MMNVVSNAVAFDVRSIVTSLSQSHLELRSKLIQRRFASAAYSDHDYGSLELKHTMKGFHYSSIPLLKQCYSSR